MEIIGMECLKLWGKFLCLRFMSVSLLDFLQSPLDVSSKNITTRDGYMLFPVSFFPFQEKARIRMVMIRLARKLSTQNSQSMDNRLVPMT